MANSTHYIDSATCNNSTCLTETFRIKVLPVSVFIGVQILLGIVGNVFVLYVFGCRYSQSTYRCFVLYLAVIDILSCVTTMPAEIVSHMFWFTYDFHFICQIKSFFNVFTVSADVLCLVPIAIDRYKQTCHPDKTQMSPMFAVYFIIGVTLVGAGLAAPGGVVGGVNHVNYKSKDTNNINVSICGVADEYQNENFDTIYVRCLQSIIGLSLGSMFVLYLAIAVDLCKGTDEQAEPLFQAKDDNSTSHRIGVRRQTILLLFVTAFFIVTIVAYLILDSLIEKRVKSYSFNETVTFLLMFRLYFLNHAINPFIYGWFDKEFRETMKSMFKCKTTK